MCAYGSGPGAVLSWGRMIKQVEAVFENGVLRPLEPLPFAEKERLFLTVSDQPKPASDRTKEHTWLEGHAAEYAGQWVALHEDALLSHGENASEVLERAWSQGVEVPLLIHVPPAEPELAFGGW